jgi:hypothetical protein
LRFLAFEKISSASVHRSITLRHHREAFLLGLEAQ